MDVFGDEGLTSSSQVNISKNFQCSDYECNDVKKKVSVHIIAMKCCVSLTGFTGRIVHATELDVGGGHRILHLRLGCRGSGFECTHAPDSNG